MGNQHFKNYSVEKEMRCIGGHCGVWKIYNGVKSDSTQRKVSIWTFDKKGMSDKGARAAREEISTFLRKESQSLLKIRHPNIVNIVEPFVEDKTSMGFITERVDDNLANLIRKNDYASICSSELELKLQIENIMKVLTFLHNDVKTAHLGLSPENIFLVNGQWKIAGFIFSTPIPASPLPHAEVLNADFTKRPFEKYIQFYPSLAFSAPEIVENPSRCTFSSDVFSLALIIMFMFQVKYLQSATVQPVLYSKNPAEYSKQLESLATHFKTQNYIQRDMNEDFKNLITRMLAKNPAVRPSLQMIKESAWMQDPFVKAIYLLENIVELDMNKQIAFVAGMTNILFKYEKPVIRKRIVPGLLELQKFEYLIPPILNVVIDCLKQPDLYSVAEFNASIAPSIVALTKRKIIPGKALYSMITSVPVFFNYFNRNDFMNIYLVPVLKCFDIPQLQVSILAQCAFLLKELDYGYTKAKIVPKVLQLCTSNQPKIMKAAIMTLQKIIPNLEKNVLHDAVLPTLDKIRKIRIADKSIIMLILDIYSSTAKSLDINVIGQKILPNLIPYLTDTTLGKKEFEAYLNTINTMIKQIEIERKKVLKDEPVDMSSVVPDEAAEELFQANKQNTQIVSQSNNNQQQMQPNQQPIEFEFLSLFETNTPTAAQTKTSLAVSKQPLQQQQQPQQPQALDSFPGDFNFNMFENEQKKPQNVDKNKKQQATSSQNKIALKTDEQMPKSLHQQQPYQKPHLAQETNQSSNSQQYSQQQQQPSYQPTYSQPSPHVYQAESQTNQVVRQNQHQQQQQTFTTVNQQQNLQQNQNPNYQSSIQATQFHSNAQNVIHQQYQPRLNAEKPSVQQAATHQIGSTSDEREIAVGKLVLEDQEQTSQWFDEMLSVQPSQHIPQNSIHEQPAWQGTSQQQRQQIGDQSVLDELQSQHPLTMYQDRRKVPQIQQQQEDEDLFDTATQVGFLQKKQDNQSNEYNDDFSLF